MRPSMEVLRDMGFFISSYEPHPPKSGGGADRFRWEEALDLLGPLAPGVARTALS